MNMGGLNTKNSFLSKIGSRTYSTIVIDVKWYVNAHIPSSPFNILFTLLAVSVPFYSYIQQCHILLKYHHIRGTKAREGDEAKSRQILDGVG